MKNVSKHYDVIIIGGGASGLMCAALIGSINNKLSVAVTEKLDRVGKKLLLTGNGRCNLTNMNVSADKYHGSFIKGAEHSAMVLSADKLLKIFDGFGLLTSADSEGRVYPQSRQSNSVLDTLRLACKRYNVDIICEYNVTDIIRRNNGFELLSENNRLIASKIVIASGSNAGIRNVSGRNMLDILRTLGHSSTDLYPALCPIKIKGDRLKPLKGIRALGKVTLLKDNKVLKCASGEIQFAEDHLSGICIFDLSFLANSIKDTVVSIDLLPDISADSLVPLLKNKIKTFTKDAKAEEFLTGYFSRMLGLSLIKESGISLKKSVLDITDQELLRLVSLIKDRRFEVIPHNDLARAQVTAGGIRGDEVDTATMMSRKCPDLYIIGEILDCHGDCGGYNLHFAFASAYCAALDICK